MTVGALFDQIRDLPDSVVAAEVLVAAMLFGAAVAVQFAAARLRRELRVAERELVDPATGLLPRGALRVRLGAEVAWALTSRTPIAVAVLRIRGSRFRHAARALRHAMREEESAFVLTDQRIAVELWGADPTTAPDAIRRLGEQLARAGHPVVDAGLACAPRDGADVDTLLGAARRELRPIDEPSVTTGPSLVPRRLAQLALRIGATGLLLLVAWRLLPVAIEPALAGVDRTMNEWIVTVIALAGLPTGAALLHLLLWNAGGGVLPRSRPLARAGVRTAAAAFALVAVPLTWGVFAPTWPDAQTPSLGAVLAVLALVVLTITSARQLVHLPSALLLVIAAAGGAVSWAAVEVHTLPVIAAAARVLVAVSIGALLARSMRRASWLVVVAAASAACALWSVHGGRGLRELLLDTHDRTASAVAAHLAIAGPNVAGHPLFQVAVIDLVLGAVLVCWAHDWRFDVRIASVTLLAAVWGGVILDRFTTAVPLIVVIALAIVGIVAGRSVLLRARVAAWRTALLDRAAPRGGV